MSARGRCLPGGVCPGRSAQGGCLTRVCLPRGMSAHSTLTLQKLLFDGLNATVTLEFHYLMSESVLDICWTICLSCNLSGKNSENSWGTSQDMEESAWPHVQKLPKVTQNKLYKLNKPIHMPVDPFSSVRGRVSRSNFGHSGSCFHFWREI